MSDSFDFTSEVSNFDSTEIDIDSPRGVPPFNQLDNLNKVAGEVDDFKYYPPITSPDFHRQLFNKMEFSFPGITDREPFLTRHMHQIQPHQLFVKNFLHPATPYNGLLMFYGTGSGKTCASLIVAEQLKPLIRATGGRIIILGKNADHVQSIFHKEMYNVNKIIKELDQGLPAGSLHCLGNTYFQSSRSRLIDENGFFVSNNKIKEHIDSFYEFYGFRQFHTKIKDIEQKKQFIEDHFNNCIFIIDEAHNLSGLEIDARSAPNLQDEATVFQAEKLRIKMIKLKKQQELNNLEMLPLVVEHETLANPKVLARIQELQKINKLIEDELLKLKESMLKILENILTTPSDLTNIAIKILKSQLRLSQEQQAAEQNKLPQELRSNKIFSFLDMFESKSCLKNDFKSFLRDTDETLKGELDGGHKAYQALKKVLMSIRQSKVILLTATPIRDRASRIVNLINILRINDGQPELKIEALFPKGEPNLDAIRQACRGYISYFRGNPKDFPEVIWDLKHHPNALERSLVDPTPDQITRDFRQTQLSLGTAANSPSMQLIECRSEQRDPQEEEYVLYLRNRDKFIGRRQTISGDSKLQLEFRCNFAFPIWKLDGESRSAKLYSEKEFFNRLFNVRKGPPIRFEYAHPELGDFMAPDQIGKYSRKLEVMLEIIDSVSRRAAGSGKLTSGGGIHIIYSKYKSFGCYLIGLALEKMGYRRYPDSSLWTETPPYAICSLCNQSKYTHNNNALGHQFKQAHYLFAAGESKEVFKYMDVLTSDENRYGETIKIVVGTSGITEGIDFKFVRYIHVFEPFYNFTLLDQLAGRGARHRSHKDYPRLNDPLDQDNTIYNYENVSMFLYTYFMSNTQLYHDEISISDSSDLSDVAESGSESQIIEVRTASKNIGSSLTRDIINYIITLKKDYQIKQVESTMKSVAVDCPLYLESNHLSSDLDYSRSCNYQKCNKFNCEYLPERISLKQTSGRLQLSVNGSSQDVTRDDTLNDLQPVVEKGQIVVGYHSGRLYSSNVSFLQQVERYGDETTDEDTVCWIIDQRDLSTFFPYIAESTARQLIPLVKFLIKEYFSIDKPIFSLTQIQELIDNHISFAIPSDYKKSLYFNSLSLIAGVDADPQMTFEEFKLVPFMLPNDIYYAIHPRAIRDIDSSSYYKYIWATTFDKSTKTIGMANWITREPEAKVKAPNAKILEYTRQLNNNPYNQFELYIFFGGKKPDELLDILYTVAVHPFDSASQEYKYRLVWYLAHYLEYFSITQIVRCTCDFYTHSKTEEVAKPNLEFIFTYENLGVIRVSIHGDKSVEHRIETGTAVRPYVETRQPNRIVLGLNEELRVKGPAFKVKSRIKLIMLEERTKKIPDRKIDRFGSCSTFSNPKREDDDDPGLGVLYDELIGKLQEIGLEDILPKRIEWKHMSEGKVKQTICHELELLLRLAHHFDDEYYYYEFKPVSKTGTPTKTTPKTRGKKAKKS